jgi:tRNA(adenine34) deaminase
MALDKASFYMSAALLEAKVAFDLGEVPVGSVIVFEGRIISKAHNLVEKYKNPLMHAEMIAILRACRLLKSKYLYKCDLYTTLEPCCMCAASISLARVEKLFYGASESKYGAVESDISFFKRADANYTRPKIIYESLLANESQELMNAFFQNLRKSK